jgi:hypothetical protein
MNEPMVTDEPAEGQKPVPSADLVDEFEMAFQVSKPDPFLFSHHRLQIGISVARFITLTSEQSGTIDIDTVVLRK